MSTSESNSQPTIFPCLYYNDAPAAIEWLARAFGFTKRLVVPGEHGAIIHAEMSLGAGVIMPRSARPAMGLRSPQDLPAVNMSKTRTRTMPGQKRRALKSRKR
jgi:uncharacterized glyoxalase superfamily protein PhnB